MSNHSDFSGEIIIRSCGICEGQHERLPIFKYRQPYPVGSETITHWGMCPTGKEPILIKMTGLPDYPNE